MRSIRWKVFGLSLGLLCLSLAATLWVSVHLSVRDRFSFVYDLSLAQARVITTRLDARVGQFRSWAEGVSRSNEAKGGGAGAPESFLMLKPSGSKFALLASGGGKTAMLQSAIDQAGWSPERLTPGTFWVGTVRSDAAAGGGHALLPVAYALSNPQVVLVALLDLTNELGAQQTRGQRTFIADSVGRVIGDVASKPGGPETAEAHPDRYPGWQALIQELGRGGFESGVREWQEQGQQPAYLVAYQRALGSEVLVVSTLLKREAYAAVAAFVLRSLAAGLGILLISFGASLVFSRQLVGRIRSLWGATLKLKAGDFEARVPSKEKGDELEDLGQAFNQMAAQIDGLLKETAVKARMEKELETAQMVQRRFLPDRSYRHDNLDLCGALLPASECAGDWWHYEVLGPYLLVAVGDVTGHGVSSALIAAGVHAAFKGYVRRWKEMSAGGAARGMGASDILKGLGAELNHAVHSAARGEAQMTMSLSVLHLETGAMAVVSAAHHPPYVLSDQVKAFMKGQTLPLGRSEVLAIEPAWLYLKPGDLVLWYTDGLVENPGHGRGSEGKMKLVRVLNEMRRKEDSVDLTPEGVMETLLKGAQEAGSHGDRPDDVTLVVARVARSAPFTAQAQGSATGSGQSQAA